MSLVTPDLQERSKTSTAPRRRGPRRTSLLAHGEPMMWLTGGSLVICMTMIVVLLGLVIYQGGATFWPRPVVEIATADGRNLVGEVAERDTFVTESGDELERLKLRTGNFDTSGTHYDWVREDEVVSTTRPEWTIVVERRAWGRFYGTPVAFLLEGEEVASEPAEVWKLFEQHHPAVLSRLRDIRGLETGEVGTINARQERARKALKLVELEHGEHSAEFAAAEKAYEDVLDETEAQFTRVREEIDAIRTVNDRYAMRFSKADGTEQTLGLADVVRAYPANRIGLVDKLGIYVSRWWEFLSAEPRESNSEGGVYPAIFGTVAMTLIMSVLVVPFGVLAALYLREYAKQGYIVSMVRIAVNNLAGVPSIVFGVFGLGFFVILIGSRIDDVFYRADLPNPTFGKGGILWASLTLALLTLPVVIVASEEALSAVPNSMRDGSYACGATKWQTIRRIVLPRAMPGIMTGMILAIARGAGEVAPLMLVGASKLAPDLPVTSEWPFVHPSRSFMHLGFHIYDVGFQSQNSEAARPMVFTTTLLLIGIVVTLNVVAIWIRARLRRRFMEAR